MKKNFSVLEQVLKEEGISTSKLLKNFGEIVGLKDKPLALWSKLSEDWVHPKGIVKRIVDHVVEKSDLPPYALVIPMNYTENDIDSLDELSRRVSDFRELLRVAMEEYKKNIPDC